MKTKIVVRVSMNDDKCRSKALQIAVGISGVESAALGGQSKDEVVVVGEGIDAVALTRQLRKKVACAELVSVGEDKKEAATAKPAETPAPQPPVIVSYALPYDGNGYGYPSYPVCQMSGARSDLSSCTIM